MQKAILIVDDNESVRAAIRLRLGSEVSLHICGEATDGQDAIEKAKRLKPDLVILDLSMPQMNGIEVAVVLTRLMPSAALILFTMHAGTVLVSAARSAGIRAVVSKEQGLEMLLGQIHTLLQNSTPARPGPLTS